MSEEFNFFPADRLARLIAVFQRVFWKSYDTKLIGGAEEPLYRPKSDHTPYNAIIFTHDYFSSALHEVAHWCVAGEERRKLEDYGYWYAPDGRSQKQQSEFEKVEVKPQALERIFAKATGHSFRVSADNLQAGLGASVEFVNAVHQQTLVYCQDGLPSRARELTIALSEAFDQPRPCSEHFNLDDLL